MPYGERAVNGLRTKSDGVGSSGGFTRFTNNLFDQIISRKFTQHQRSILDLIIRLSIGCRQDVAKIPKQKHFSACGVAPNKIRNELDRLKSMNVIDWSEEGYWVNQDFDSWAAESQQVRGEMLRYLLNINLAEKLDYRNIHVGDVCTSTPARNTQTRQNGKLNLVNPMSQTNESSPKSNLHVPKQGYDEHPKQDVRQRENAVVKGNLTVSKDITTEKYTDEITDDEKDPIKSLYSELMNEGRKIFAPYSIGSGTITEMVCLLAPELLSVNLGVEALRVTKALHKDEGFAPIKLRRWLQRGFKSVEEAREFENGFNKNNRNLGLELPLRNGATHKRVDSNRKERDERYNAFYRLFPDE